MRSTRVWIAMATLAIVVLGGVACSGGDGTATKAPVPAAAEANTPSAAEATTPATVPATAAATPEGTGSEASGDPAAGTPSVEEIQGLLAAMTAQLQQAAAAGPDTPAPTSAEIEAQLLEQLRQLGIPL